MVTIKVRILKEDGTLADVPVRLHCSFNGNFKINPSPVPTEHISEYEIETDATTCTLKVLLGDIEIVSYSGEVKDVDLIIPNEKYEAIRKLLG